MADRAALLAAYAEAIANSNPRGLGARAILDADLACERAGIPRADIREAARRGRHERERRHIRSLDELAEGRR